MTRSARGPVHGTGHAREPRPARAERRRHGPVQPPRPRGRAPGGDGGHRHRRPLGGDVPQVPGPALQAPERAQGVVTATAERPLPGAGRVSPTPNLTQYELSMGQQTAALQLWTVRDAFAADADGALSRVKATGFSA